MSRGFIEASALAANYLNGFIPIGGWSHTSGDLFKQIDAPMPSATGFHQIVAAEQ
jgi:hypothetical protein